MDELTIPAARKDAGATLVEACWATVVVGVLGAAAFTSLQGWTAAHEHAAAASAVQTVLQEAQLRAVADDHDVCVDFDTAAQSYSVYRGACDSARRVVLQGPTPAGSGARLASPSFNGPSGVGTGVTFAPRGTAWPGSVKVTRPGSSKVWTIGVEGRTGRISRA